MARKKHSPAKSCCACAPAPIVVNDCDEVLAAIQSNYPNYQTDSWAFNLPEFPNNPSCATCEDDVIISGSINGFADGLGSGACLTGDGGNWQSINWQWTWNPPTSNDYLACGFTYHLPSLTMTCGQQLGQPVLRLTLHKCYFGTLSLVRLCRWAKEFNVWPLDIRDVMENPVLLDQDTLRFDSGAGQVPPCNPTGGINPDPATVVFNAT